MIKLKFGFTLAEILITVSIITIVASITLPTFLTNITERQNSERQANIAQKVTQAMEQMRAHGLLNQSYPTTEAFVDELQKYLKIVKRCDKEHIADCWPTKKVITGEGKEYDISYLKTGGHLKLKTTTNNVGLVLNDGASIILNYNSDANTLDVGDRISSISAHLPVGGKSKEFVYTSEVTNSIDFIMDVNGAKGPNSETRNNKWHDIRSFNIAKIAGCTGAYIPEIGCIVHLKTFEPVTDPEKSEFVATYCESDGWCKDYWQGAVNACKNFDTGYELTDNDALTIIYNKKNNYSGLPQSGTFWSSSVGSGYYAWRALNFSGGAWYAINIDRKNPYGALCVKK